MNHDLYMDRLMTCMCCGERKLIRPQMHVCDECFTGEFEEPKPEEKEQAA